MVHMSCVKKEFLSLRHILNEVLTDEIMSQICYFLIFIFIYLIALALSCSMWGL